MRIKKNTEQHGREYKPQVNVREHLFTYNSSFSCFMHANAVRTEDKLYL